MATLIDSYDPEIAAPANYTYPALYGDFGGGTGYGQAFNNPTSCTLDSCKFYLKTRTGTPAGNLRAELYASTGTLGTDAKPTGSALAVSDNVAASTLTSSPALITFNFSGANRITLSASTDYIIIVRYPDGTADANDAAGPGYDSSSPTHAGNYSETTGFVNWTAFSTIDIAFYIYKADAVAAANHWLLMGV